MSRTGLNGRHEVSWRRVKWAICRALFAVIGFVVAARLATQTPAVGPRRMSATIAYICQKWKIRSLAAVI
jgi:hypothetical protein